MQTDLDTAYEPAAQPIDTKAQSLVTDLQPQAQCLSPSDPQAAPEVEILEEEVLLALGERLQTSIETRLAAIFGHGSHWPGTGQLFLLSPPPFILPPRLESHSPSHSIEVTKGFGS